MEIRCANPPRIHTLHASVMSLKITAGKRASSGPAALVNQVEELHSRFDGTAEVAKHRTGCRAGILFFHAPHQHAHMLRFDNHSDSKRLDRLINGLGNLRRQPFLHLEPAAEHLDKTHDFADADHFLVRKVTDVAFAEKGEQMMFAHAEEIDIGNDDHFIVLDVKQRIIQKLFRIHRIAACKELIGFLNPFGRAYQALAIGILSNFLDDPANVFLHAFPLYALQWAANNSNILREILSSAKFFSGCH